jgi:starvation-inducible DNA-binding protein
MQLQTTRIDLSAEVREQMVTSLNQSLANAADLFSQTKQAHWNVKGMEFIQLHELFDKLAAEVLEYTDSIAERITALGGVAQGTIRMAAEMTQLPEFAAGLGEGKAFTKLLADRWGQFGNDARAGIDAAAEAGDQATADLYTNIARDVDKWLWFLEAHLR